MNRVKLFSAVVVTALGVAVLPLVAGAQTMPSVSSIIPNVVGVGSGGISIYVNGSGYVNGSWVNVNGNPRATGYISSSQLAATIPASDLAFSGSLAITVSNPAWVSGSVTTSNAVALTITGNPPAVMGITSISPNSAMAGSSVVVMTVNGYGFIGGAVVSYNGLALTTTYLSSTQLLAAIPASYLAQAGDNVVRVTNPGGMASNGLTFMVSAVPGLPDTGFGPANGQNNLTLLLAIAAAILLSGALIGRLVIKRASR